MINNYGNFIGSEISKALRCKIWEDVLDQFLQKCGRMATQYPEINSNKVLNTIHKTYMGLTSMLQGFQKCIA